MENKICIVTGANAGIGKMTAKGLAEKGATVLLVCRTAEKAEAARKDIVAATGNDRLHTYMCDLSSQAQLRTLAAQLQADHAHIDVLINNAGAFYSKPEYSEDGIEMQFATNHLAYFLLTNLLLEQLKAAKAARIVNVSSNSHYKGVIAFDNLNQDKKTYKGMKAYQQSKLGNVLFTFELARRLQDSKVTANCLHPGVVATNIAQKHSSPFIRTAWGLLKPFMVNTAKGAATSLHVATAPELAGVTGKYFDNCREKKAAKAAFDMAVAQRLWKVSAQLTGL